MLQKIEKRNSFNKNRLLIIVGSLIFLLGVFIYAFNIYNNKTLDIKDNEQVNDFIDKNKEVKVQEIKINDEIIESKEQTTPSSKINEYIGVIEIPKINVKRGFYNIENTNNNVNKNVEVIKGSSMPNVEKGNFILAAHSGSGRVAFFKNVYKLENQDEIFIYFNNTKYKYQVIDKYEVDKIGKVLIHRDKDITALTLTTCSQTDKTKQIVVIAKLIEEEHYE